jgi:integrase
MAEISMDLISGHYDPTLLKYRPLKLGINPTQITAVKLLGKYTIHYQQERSLTRGSVLKLKGITSKFQRFTGDILAHKVTDSVAKNIGIAMA